MEAEDPLFAAILKKYQALCEKDPSEYESGSATLDLPKIPLPDLTKLCAKAASIFAKEPSLLILKHPVLVIGDLHGHLISLLRILRKYGIPPKKYHYLFLGDLVDRGEFSTEVTELIFNLKILYPNQIYVIRGNHEFQQLCHEGGFYYELRSLYGDSLAEPSFLNAFHQIPIAAQIGKILCVHGGIGPSVSLQAIQSIQRPIMCFDDELVTSILWSDPNEDVSDYIPSHRGMGNYFGTRQITDFLTTEKLTLLVRGHECVNTGVAYHLNRKVVTVFSAANYCGATGNKGGVMMITPLGQTDVHYFPSMRYILRSEAQFVPLYDPVGSSLPPLGRRRCQSSEIRINARKAQTRLAKQSPTKPRTGAFLSVSRPPRVALH